MGQPGLKEAGTNFTYCSSYELPNFEQIALVSYLEKPL
jgi:hypothetical protein